MPLPQNVKAYILAVTDTEDGPAWGIQEFMTSRAQTIEVELNVGTKEGFNKAIDNLQMGRLHIKVDDAVNASEIRKTDTAARTIDEALKNAEVLKPKACDCDCIKDYTKK